MTHLVILRDPACVLMSDWLSFQAGEWCEPITLRPPNEATSSTPVQYWQHHPEKLIFQSCDYEAYVSPHTSPHLNHILSKIYKTDSENTANIDIQDAEISSFLAGKKSVLKSVFKTIA